MAHFIVALLQLWLFFLLNHLQIVAFSGSACEVVQNKKTKVDCGRCAGECKVVANVSHSFSDVHTRKSAIANSHVSTVIENAHRKD